MEISKYINKIITGDAKEILKSLPNESIDCVITSPPYWALRDYGTGKWIGGDLKCDHKKNPPAFSEKALAKSTIGAYANTGHAQENYMKICGKCGAKREDKQLGLEPTFQEYISKLCDVFDEAKRVLKKEGTCWVNMGDTYSAQRWTGSGKGQAMNKFRDGHRDLNPEKITGMEDKCLVQIPSRFAIEMANRGWILRNEIIWHKPNCMPSSVKDRFTVDFEKMFFFVKNKKYYFETQYEKYSPNTFPRMLRGVGRNNKWTEGPDGQTEHTMNQPRNNIEKDFFEYQGQGIKDYGNVGVQNPSDVKRRILKSIKKSQQGRNKRCVWQITTKPFKEAHFATFPPKLIETPIKAGCPELICKACGKPRGKLFKSMEIGRGVSNTKYNTENSTAGRLAQKRQAYRKMGFDSPPLPEFSGYSDCGCNAGFNHGIVLDMFIGSGTTAVVAMSLGLNFIGIELNPNYVAIAEKRIREASQKLL